MLLLSPLLVGVVIRSFGWMVILADNGLINSLLKTSGLAPDGVKLMYNELGVLVGTVHIYLPFMVLSISGTLAEHRPRPRAGRAQPGRLRGRRVPADHLPALACPACSRAACSSSSSPSAPT